MGERQIEISGVDAANFVQYLTCRDMSSCAVNQCKYSLLLNTEGGIVCDPIILRLEKNKFWSSKFHKISIFCCFRAKKNQTH